MPDQVPAIIFVNKSQLYTGWGLNFYDENQLTLPMFTHQEPYLYVNFTDQLIFIQENYLVDIS